MTISICQGRGRIKVMLAAMLAMLALVAIAQAVAPSHAKALIVEDDCSEFVCNHDSGGGRGSGGAGPWSGADAHGTGVGFDPAAGGGSPWGSGPEPWSAQPWAKDDPYAPTPEQIYRDEQKTFEELQQDFRRALYKANETPAQKAERQRLERQGFTPVYSPGAELVGYCVVPIGDILAGSGSSDDEKAEQLNRFCFDAPGGHVGHSASRKKSKGGKGGRKHG